METDNSAEEYKDVSANMRHFGNMRFAQLTLFVAVTAGLLNALFRPEPPLTPLVLVLLKVGGLITTISFWVMEERTNSYWLHSCRRAVVLEEKLGFAQYTRRLARYIINATNASRVLYALIVLFWLASLIWKKDF